MYLLLPIYEPENQRWVLQQTVTITRDVKRVTDRHIPDTNMQGPCLFTYNPQMDLSGENRYYHDKKTYIHDKLKFWYDKENIT